MLNHIALMGRLTRDPELRRTQSGIAVANFTLAVDRDYKAENGDRGVDFVDCTVWRSGAEFAQKYFTKGQMACVSGRLQSRDWTDKEGGKRRSWEVLVDNLYFAGAKKDAPSDSRETPTQAGSMEELKGKFGSVFTEADEGDGELPF